jgi:lysophospholipase L1-like esterase
MVKYHEDSFFASMTMNVSPSPSWKLSLTALVLVLGTTGELAAAEPAGGAGSQWQLHDGERVVLLGDTLFERDGQLGLIETALVTAFPEADLEFRNLGWGGDTVWADSRGVFDPPAKGYARMTKLVDELAPDVIFIAYGRNESFAGDQQLDAFGKQLDKLCVDLCHQDSREPSGRPRLVLVTPSPFEQQTTCPNADAKNAVLARYAAVIRKTAVARQAGLVDLFADWPTAAAAEASTTDGIHLSPFGYQTAARLFVAAAGRQLPDDWATRTAPVREQINAKNQLFFHRWRPANETYLFLFRKHEQGNNAAEIPRFDPLVAAAEADVRTARDALPAAGDLP